MPWRMGSREGEPAQGGSGVQPLEIISKFKPNYVQFNELAMPLNLARLPLSICYFS